MTATEDESAADPFDPFGEHRRQDGAIAGRVGRDEFVMALRYDDLKRVAREWETFSSDAPFRVPIPSEHDVRSVRQLPIETDPPDHADYREIVKDVFSRTTSARIAPQVQTIVGELLDDAFASDGIDVIRSFALPLQSRAAALMLGRPRHDADLWISWGTHVFREGHAAELDAYLERTIDEALADPGVDFFGTLVRGRFRGRPLTRQELLGFANVTLAGGRDTVLNSVGSIVWHLAGHPDLLPRLAADEGLVRTAVEEFLRFYTPLTHIGRVTSTSSCLAGRDIDPDTLVSLGFASANRDETTFDRAGECLLDRWPNRHVAFGHGPHICLGAPHARMVLTTTIEAIAHRVSSMTILEAVPKIDDIGPLRRQTGFDRLVVRMAPG
jgi:cytochrome P450